jgi:murein DD-endopeptidase MepM/ murein hydrolase activator NlpD
MLNIFKQFATTASHILICALFAPSVAFSQEPAISLTVNSNRVSINYSLADTNGMFFIIEHTNPISLLTDGNVLFSGYASNGLAGNFAADATSPEDFFTVMADALAASYTETPPIDDDEDPSTIQHYYYEVHQPIPPLVSGNAVNLSISVVDVQRKPMDVDGTLALVLVSKTRNDVPFSYTISPDSIPVVHGVASATIVVTSDHDLSQAFLGGSFSPNQSSGSIRPLTKKPSDPIGMIATVPLSSYADKTAGWIYPLPDVFSISGGFGEWPGHKDIHWGIDLLAPATEPVLAAKGGVVSHVGFIESSPNKQFVIVDHGIGFATCYMHIVPLVNEGDVVAAGDVIGKVADTSYTGYPVHLHFEVMQSPSDIGTNYVYSDARYPFPVINPVSSSLVFNIPFLNNNAPQLASFQLQNSKVVVQAVDNEGGPVITPLSILFQADGNPDQNISFLSSSNTIRNFRTSIPGYAQLSPPEKGERDKWYKFIFNWDTSSYANAPDGPRTICITLTDLGGLPNAYYYTFGASCEVEFANRPHTDQVTYYTATVTGYLGDDNAPSPPPDNYILTLTGGGAFLDSGSGALTTPAFTQNGETHIYQFTAPYTQIAPVQLKVQSQLFPTIMHLLDVQELPR